MSASANILPFSLSNIFHTCGKDTALRGEDYYKQGRVRSVILDGGKFYGVVQGHGKNRYTQKIEIRHHGTIHGLCSCPMDWNCKHVAAVLMYVLNHPQLLNSDLARETQEWLNQLKETYEGTIKQPKTSSTKAIYYLLDKAAINPTCSLPHLRLIRAETTKSGLIGKQERYNPSTVIHSRRQIPSYILEDDYAIMLLLAKCTPHFTADGWVLQEGDYTLLERILKTEKCYWKTINPTILTLGPKRLAHFAWEKDHLYRQKLSCQAEEPIEQIFAFSHPWYIDLKQSQCGPLEFDIPSQLASRLLQIPLIKPEEANTVRQSLTQLNAYHLPLPQSFEQREESLEEAPIPSLVFYGQSFYPSYYDYEVKTLALAKVEFSYKGHKVQAHDSKTTIGTIEEGVLVKIKRDFQAEKLALEYLQTLLPKIQPLHQWSERLSVPEKQAHDFVLGSKNGKNPISEEEWHQVSQKGLKQLEQKGWQITILESFPYKKAVFPEEWFADMEENQEKGWFDLELGIQIGEEKLNLLPILLQLVRNTPSLLENKLADVKIPIGKARELILPKERARTILAFLKDLYGFNHLSEKGRLRLSSKDIGEMKDLERVMQGLKTRWVGGERLRRLAQEMQSFQGIQPIKPPHSLKADLRPYQQIGLNWLQFLKKYSLPGILADDMGLGKTLQTLAHILYEKENKHLDKPILVISPTSVVTNWYQEAQKFAPTLSVLTIHGSGRHDLFEEIKGKDIILTTYPLLIRDEEKWLKEDFHTIILDEAHYIKNPKAKVAMIASQLKANHRLCLTGTPIENHLGELWALFNFAWPGFLGSEAEFNQFFRKPIEKEGNTERQQALIRRISPFILRRHKDEVAAELPQKTEIIKKCSLDKHQKDLYETMRMSMHKKVQDVISQKGLAKSHIIILDALLKLRQICCDPRLVKSETARKVDQSAKLDLLLEMLEEMLAEGRRILLFSQFTSMLALIEEELQKKKVPYIKLTGDTQDRASLIQQFQDGKVPLFLISLKAGGIGLNLTAADTVIHYDPWWNPAVENQATDRAYRIGQNKPVFVYKLIAEGTIEEKILELQHKKRAVAQGILENNQEKITHLSAEDIQNLFA